MSPRLNVAVEGRGPRTLVLVHGAACDRHDWDAQCEALARRFRIVTLDLPGHGESAPCAQATVGCLADAVVQAKEEHGGPRAVLVGHSLGCRVILEAYRRAPSHVQGLIFVDASPLAAEGDRAAVAALAARMEAAGTQAYLQSVFEQMFVADSDPAVRAAILARTRRWDPTFGRALLLDLCRWDAEQFSPALSAVTIPFLLLQSTYRTPDSHRRSLQPYMSTPWIDRLKALVPHATVRIVSGVGHFPHVEAPATVAAHIAEFAEKAHT